MARINIIDEHGQHTGHFNPDRAELFDEGTYWDGNNNVSRNSRVQHGHERLYRTLGGKWVLHTWSEWESVRDAYRYIEPEQALAWLVASEEHGEAIAKHFGEQPDESDVRPGRPAIEGPEWKVKFSSALAEGVDAAADAANISRAEWIRRACEAALS